MTQYAGSDHRNRDAGYRERNHGSGQPPLGGKTFHQPDGRAQEIAGPLCGGLNRSTDGPSHRQGHYAPPTLAPSDCDSTNWA